MTAVEKIIEWIEPTLSSDRQIDKVALMVVLKGHLPIEKQDLQRAFEAGTKYGYQFARYVSLHTEPDNTLGRFNQFYSQLKGE